MLGDYRITAEDKERIKLLRIVQKDSLKALDMKQLEKLQILVEKKDYSHDKKAKKSKAKLLTKINVAIYETAEGTPGI